MEAQIDQGKVKINEEGGGENLNDATGWNYLGNIHLLNDRDDRATKCYLKALELEPENTETLFALGVSCLNEVEEFEAVGYIIRWVKSHSVYSKYLTGVSSSLVPNVNMNSPVEYYEIVKKEKENMIETYSNRKDQEGLNQLLAEIDKRFYNALLKLLDSITKKENSSINTDIYIVKGIVSFLAGNTEKAVESFKTAAEINPLDAFVLNKYGGSLAHSQNYLEAIKVYKKAIELKPNYSKCWINLGTAYYNLNQGDDCIKAYLCALRVFPDFPHAWNYISIVALSREDKDLVSLVKKQDLDALCKRFDIIEMNSQD